MTTFLFLGKIRLFYKLINHILANAREYAVENTKKLIFWLVYSGNLL
jgi:hypothetical protein